MSFGPLPPSTGSSGGGGQQSFEPVPLWRMSSLFLLQDTFPEQHSPNQVGESMGLSSVDPLSKALFRVDLGCKSHS